MRHELKIKEIVVKEGEVVNIGEEMLEQKLNLEVQSRYIGEYSTLVKCADCNALVYEDLMPPKRWRDVIEGKQWTCTNEKCKRLY